MYMLYKNFMYILYCYIYIYIYIYIYECELNMYVCVYVCVCISNIAALFIYEYYIFFSYVDCFLESQLINVARHA